MWIWPFSYGPGIFMRHTVFTRRTFLPSHFKINPHKIELEPGQSQRMHGRTDWQMHIHTPCRYCGNYVLLPASRLNKNAHTFCQRPFIYSCKESIDTLRESGKYCFLYKLIAQAVVTFTTGFGQESVIIKISRSNALKFKENSKPSKNRTLNISRWIK